MTVISCIAGLPAELCDRVKAEPKRFAGHSEVKPIVRPLKGDLSFRNGMEIGYLSDLANEVSKLPKKKDVSIIIGYAHYPGSSTIRFVNNFFPFALSVPFQPFYPYEFQKHERQMQRSLFLDRLSLRLANARESAAKVKDKLSGQNFSPITLPVRNFQSPVLESTLTDLFFNLWESDDADTELKKSISKILDHHPKKRIKYDQQNHSSDPNKPYFLDDRKLRFKSPGDDLHGLLREVNRNHNSTCLIASRSRLGGPVLSGLHYDCDYFPKRALSDKFPNCHDEEVSSKKLSHANIAINDAVW